MSGYRTADSHSRSPRCLATEQRTVTAEVHDVWLQNSGQTQQKSTIPSYRTADSHSRSPRYLATEQRTVTAEVHDTWLQWRTADRPLTVCLVTDAQHGETLRTGH
ncbi:hypothetical protein ACOMHN_019246 [Nucella lapillus]